MNNMLYPNHPIVNPVVKTKAQQLQENQTRERLQADLPACEWCLDYLNKAIAEVSDISSVVVDPKCPEATTIQIASLKQTRGFLIRMKGEMEKRIMNAQAD